MKQGRWTVLIGVIVITFLLISLSTSSHSWGAPSLRIQRLDQHTPAGSNGPLTSDVYTAKAKTYDLFRASRPGWDALGPIIKNIPKGMKILDLGCGTGAFLEQLVLVQPSQLVGIDTNQAMIDAAMPKLIKLRESAPLASFPTVVLRQGNVTAEPSAFYDIVFCAQILQNLTPHPSFAASARHDFLVHIWRVLKPGGKLILTTRAVSLGPAGRYADLYWYADPDIVPRAVSTMEQMVPRKPLEELANAGFVQSESIPSKETVIKIDAYLNPSHVNNEAFRSADSFFQHVDSSELDCLLKSIERRQQDGTMNGYIKRREFIRGNNGHVETLIAYKTPSATI